MIIKSNESKRRSEKEKMDWLVLEPRFDVKDVNGSVHRCRLHSTRPVRVPDRGVFLSLWFEPVVWMPNPSVYGPYIYGKMGNKAITDERMVLVNPAAERKLKELLARASGMRYQSTPLVRLGTQDAEYESKIYRR